jgi:hypothetical protein
MAKKSTGVGRRDIRRPFGDRASSRKKRILSEPRRYTLFDLERARDRAEAVCRQSFWDKERLKLRESLARLVCNVMRLDDGASSGD